MPIQLVPIASDAFARTVTDGWGEADLGGTWATSGTASQFSVASGQGRISPNAGQTREARLADILASSVVVTGIVSFSARPGGGNCFAYIVTRGNGTTNHRSTIRFDPQGRIWIRLKRAINDAEQDLVDDINTGLVFDDAARVAFKVEEIGSTIRMRVWDPDESEPDTWTLETEETAPDLQGSGDIGLRVVIGGSVPNAPITVSLEDWEAGVWTEVPDPVVAHDDVATVMQGESVLIDVLANDEGEGLAISHVNALNGDAAIEDGRIRYTPDPEFIGSDELAYAITDGNTSDAAAVTVMVTAAPQPEPGSITETWTISGSITVTVKRARIDEALS